MYSIGWQKAMPFGTPMNESLMQNTEIGDPSLFGYDYVSSRGGGNLTKSLGLNGYNRNLQFVSNDAANCSSACGSGANWLRCAYGAKSPCNSNGPNALAAKIPCATCPSKENYLSCLLGLPSTMCGTSDMTGFMGSRGSIKKNLIDVSIGDRALAGEFVDQYTIPERVKYAQGTGGFF